MELDEVFNQLGQFGKYQRFVYFIVCLIGIPAAFNNMGIVFLAGTPDHWCAVPELSAWNLSEEMTKNLSLPRVIKDGVERYDQCEMYDINYTELSPSNVYDYINNRNTSTLQTKGCQENHKWVYDKSLYTNTVVMQWDLVCGKSWMAATAASIYMAGLMVGVVFFGWLSDWIGRRKVMMITIVLGSGFMVACAFSPNIYVFYAIRFLVATCTISAFTTGFVIGIELVGTSWRVFAGVVVEFFWAFGYLLVAGIAYGVRDWFTLQLVLSSGMFLCYVCFLLVPESARWLYANGRPNEGEKILRKAAKVNGKTLPDKLDVVVSTETGNRATIIDLVRTPNMRRRSLNIFFNWFVNSLVYYGLSLNTSNLGGDPYLNFAISAAVEVPSYLMSLLLLQYMGRRIPLGVSMIIGGVALLATLPVPAHLNIIAVVLAMIGKFCISASFAIIYVFSAELFPTVVRNVGVGCGSFWARVGGIIAPYVGELSKFSRFIPLTLFGAVSIAAGLLALFLPETRNKNLPETILDGENFGRKKDKVSIPKGVNAMEYGRYNPAFTVDSYIKGDDVNSANCDKTHV